MRDTFTTICLRRAVAAFLAVAVMGAFALSAETLRFGEAEGSRSGLGNFFELTNHVDWLAEDAASMGKANRNTSFSLRNGAFMPAGMPNVAERLSGSLPQILRHCIPISKNAVQVKLRI